MIAIGGHGCRAHGGASDPGTVLARPPTSRFREGGLPRRSLRGLGGLAAKVGFGLSESLIMHICICAYMPSRNIAVQKAVYEALEREKRTGESFTSVLRRLLEHPRGLDDVWGAWGGRGARADRTRLRALRSGGSRS